MPNAASLSQHGAPSLQRLIDPDRDQSPAEYSSGIDSDNDQGANGSGGSRALKRKRPLTVSYVPDQATAKSHCNFEGLAILTMLQDVSSANRGKSSVVCVRTVPEKYSNR